MLIVRSDALGFGSAHQPREGELPIGMLTGLGDPKIARVLVSLHGRPSTLDPPPDGADMRTFRAAPSPCDSGRW